MHLSSSFSFFFFCCLVVQFWLEKGWVSVAQPGVDMDIDRIILVRVILDFRSAWVSGCLWYWYISTSQLVWSI
jgi:hypothetical protein